MSWSRAQKSLSERIFRTLELHLMEWDIEFDQVLEVIDAVRHGINVQRTTKDRKRREE